MKTNINNNELSTSGAMPLKDNMSDGTNTFSLFRHRHMKSPLTTTTQETTKKKWYGNSSNRASSLISDKRNDKEVGFVSKNVDNGVMTFTSHTNRNDVSQAISRARSGGYVVSNKVRSSRTKQEDQPEDYYTPQPFHSILKSAYTSSLPSIEATSFTTLNRYMIKYGSDYLTIDASFNLVLTSELDKYSDILPKVLEAVRDPSNNNRSYRIDSDLNNIYSLDCSSATSHLRWSNNWGQAANTSSGYVQFDYSGNNLIAKGRQRISDTSYNHSVDTQFNAIGYYVCYNSTDKRFVLTLSINNAAIFTLYKSPIQADMPSEFNPYSIPYQPNKRVSISKYVGPTAKNTIAFMDRDVKRKVSSTYSGQVDVSGWSVNTDLAASIMLDDIFSTVNEENNSLRYDKAVYKAFRTAALKTTLGCNSIADGTIGQNTVPYVYFTNEVLNGVHHPFMVMASYSISDKPNRLIDVCRPPSDGTNYANDDVTRDATLQNYLIKIPMLNYGQVTSCTSSDKNVMLKTLLSDANASDSEGLTDTPYNYASISAIGVAVDGVVIYPVANNTLRPAQAQAEITNTGIHIGKGMGLHYHADGQGATQNNMNLYNTSDYISRKHPPLIGFGFDGIALYGQYDSNFTDMHGYYMGLDEFGGHEHGNYGYHYHAHTINSTLAVGVKTESSGVGGAGLTSSLYNLRILMKGAWKGRINNIPMFWDATQNAPSFTIGKNNSIYAGFSPPS
jgi:hypothetical protein